MQVVPYRTPGPGTVLPTPTYAQPACPSTPPPAPPVAAGTPATMESTRGAGTSPPTLTPEIPATVDLTSVGILQAVQKRPQVTPAKYITQRHPLSI